MTEDINIEVGQVYLNLSLETGIPKNAVILVTGKSDPMDRPPNSYDVVVIKVIGDQDIPSYMGWDFGIDETFVMAKEIILLSDMAEEDLFLLALEHGVDLSGIMDTLK